MELIRATSGDAETLTRIAHEAKRHWGYPEAWIERWRDELTIRPDWLWLHPATVAVVDDAAVGFNGLEIEGRTARLSHLWVRPSVMGRGIGRTLFRDAEIAARSHGCAELVFESDPNAEGFYLRMGAARIGEIPASMDGRARVLPVFRKIL